MLQCDSLSCLAAIVGYRLSSRRARGAATFTLTTQSLMVFHVHVPNPIPASTHKTSMASTFAPINVSASDAPGKPVLTLINVINASPNPFPPKRD